ncbi:MAG TPA: hypothetical protein PLU49_08120 [Saprospiraceae bacterium]|mgnify:CR=1 FL=1|nr:hypothetical protein [Saprospiraceae bacterium]
MRILIICIILCLSSFIQAQHYKNEIKVGVPLGVYFFDNTSITVHRLNTRGIPYIPLPTFFSYTRHMNKNFAITANFMYYWLVYGDPGRLFFPGEILLRGFYSSSVIIKNNLVMNPKFKIGVLLGGVFRYGDELVHLATLDHGTWREAIIDNRPYKDFGILIGTETKYNFTKRLNVGFNIDYTRYFAETSPNQLSTAIFLGYEF